MVDFGLAVHLGDQRAGGVEREQVAAAGFGRNGARNPVRREDDRLAVVRDLVEFLDENGALLAQAVDHVAVMDYFVADIDRCAMNGERPFHALNGPHDAGAEAAWRAQQNLEKGFFGAFGHVRRPQMRGLSDAPCPTPTWGALPMSCQDGTVA